MTRRRSPLTRKRTELVRTLQKIQFSQFQGANEKKSFHSNSPCSCNAPEQSRHRAEPTFLLAQFNFCRKPDVSSAGLKDLSRPRTRFSHETGGFPLPREHRCTVAVAQTCVPWTTPLYRCVTRASFHCDTDAEVTKYGMLLEKFSHFYILPIRMLTLGPGEQ